MKTKKTIKSILDAVATAKQKRTVVKKLRENESYVLKSILQANYNPNINFSLPAGAPPYTPSETDVEFDKTLMNRFATLTTNNRKLNKMAKEMAFISLLECVSPGDAEILIAVKDGELETLYPMITEDTVRDAYPKTNFTGN